MSSRRMKSMDGWPWLVLLSVKSPRITQKVLTSSPAVHKYPRHERFCHEGPGVSSALREGTASARHVVDPVVQDSKRLRKHRNDGAALFHRIWSVFEDNKMGDAGLV